MKILKYVNEKTVEGKIIKRTHSLPELNPAAEGALTGFLTLLKQLYTGSEVALYSVETIKIG